MSRIFVSVVIPWKKGMSGKSQRCVLECSVLGLRVMYQLTEAVVQFRAGIPGATIGGVNRMRGAGR
jgi:hypothetical protein